jgi:hypothetical protein
MAVASAALVLATGCSGGETESTGRRAPSPTPTAETSPEATAPESPTSGDSVCSAVTDELATQLYGRPVTVNAGATCLFEEEDFLEQDVNVLWSLEAAPDATMADIRRGLGVRSDDARRTTLAGGVPAWEVRLTDVRGVMLTALVDGKNLFVSATANGLADSPRPIDELATIARGIAQAYTG